MKFTCERSLLSDAVLNVSKAVSAKSTLPILEGILLKAKENSLYLCGYNLEMAITTEIEATVLEQGELVLNARLFSDMVRKMPSDTILLETDDRLMTLIKGDNTEFNILGISSSEYPDIPTADGESVARIDGETFKSMIEQTLFSVAITEQKPVHTGVLFEIDNQNLRLVAVDGFRLALRQEKIGDFPEKTFIVPGKTLSEISKLIKDNEQFLEITLSNKNITFDCNGYQIISRLLEGDFLDYKNVIQISSTSEVIVEKREFFDSVERASLIINDRIKSPIVLDIADNAIKVSSTTSIGRVNDEINCEISGDDVRIGFNNKYLLDALRAAQDEKIKVLLNGSLSPMRITPLEGDDYLFLILPVRLKDE